MNKILMMVHGFILVALLAACAAPAGGSQASLVQSSKPRDTSPKVGSGDSGQLASDNRSFALGLFQQLRGREGNLFFSPHSISVALAMTYAGARGATQQQMQQAMRFNLPAGSLHPAFNALQLELAKREKDKNDDQQTHFKLSVVNALWGQSGYTFLPDFLDNLAQNYAAGIRLLDYKSDPDAARKVINDWVAQQTADKIKDLIPQPAIDRSTILVLTNAIYFNAPWLNPFQESQTAPGPFTLLNGSHVNVALMHISRSYSYAHKDGLSAIELPYAGGQVAMVVLVPDAGKFNEIEQGFSAAQWDAIRKELKTAQVNLALPKFKFSAEFKLNDPLVKMGMVDAFDVNKADFSGMDGSRSLFISSVLHKAFINLDEKGTEAAAATAVVVGLTSMPAEVVELKIDRPFLFLIQDKPTGEILFMGRVVNPLQ